MRNSRERHVREFEMFRDCDLRLFFNHAVDEFDYVRMFSIDLDPLLLESRKFHRRVHLSAPDSE